MTVRRLSSTDPGFDTALDELLSVDTEHDQQVREATSEILAQVRSAGDTALLELTNRFDQRDLRSADELIVDLDPDDIRRQLADDAMYEALVEAADRIRRYHERQLGQSWRYEEADGTVLGQKITALERVGVYVPGGKAAYPSSVLMNVIPARVAGVSQIIMTVPAPRGVLAPAVLAAAAIAGVDQAFTIGGAQAIGALAYGTESVPQVDKIVGPGNAYVAAAKAQVFGRVGIDMIAGPSEILIICDGKTDPDWIAMDLFSQAEHDEDARAVLLSDDGPFIDTVQERIEALLPQMERSDIIRASLSTRGALIQVRDLEEAAQISNRLAPEHLELSVADPEGLCEHITHAGAIFMGRLTPEAFGDYCAGPNHVLPTARTARFSSPLGVYDFQKRSSLIMSSPAGAARMARTASVLANGEGLTAHARSASMRS